MTTSISVLITGASGGIGRAAAFECASRGARIGVHYNANLERAEATLAALPGDGHQLFQCDIVDAEAAQQLIEQADRAFGGLDVLVNNAGISQRLNFEDIDYDTWRETWRRIVDTNLTAAANLCFCAGKKMIDRGGGRIVNLSSRGAFRGEPLMPWYGASKAGMNAMGQSLAQALGPRVPGAYLFIPWPRGLSRPKWRPQCWLRRREIISEIRAASDGSRNPRNWAKPSLSWRWKRPNS